MKRAEIIKELIKETGLNTKVFAEKAGLPYTTLRSMLARGIGNASVINVIKVCRTLEITVEQLEEMASDNRYEIQTIAAHHDGEQWTEEELEEIEMFKEFVKMRKRTKSQE